MRRFLFAFLGLIVLLLSGCGGINGDYGTLTLEMVDAPSNVSSVRVHIKRIEVEIAGNWEVVAHPNQEYELLDLQAVPAVLGQSGLGAGIYTAIRVVITSATVVDSSGTHNVAIDQVIKEEGLEIPVTFEMESARRTTVLMDFNVAQSLKLNPGGTYSLDPVIPTVVKHESGTVCGFVTLNGLGVGGADIEAVYVAGPNYATGTLVNTGRSQGDGAFKVWALLPGEYRIDITGRDPITGFVTKATVNGVIVGEGLDTQIGGVSLD